ncbi:fumarate hydratase C-terminal domain-containing protein [Candidatus Bipolaricaulota bacterium]|nr:fumarate hydratase C-terminal domain-containing protein [Candidatus Bipolaricaulota bacterium]
MKRILTTPISEQEARDLHVGDVIYITGTMFTARDEAHLTMLEQGAPFPIEGLALYHCGPVVKQDDGGWEIVSAGPTTSARMEIFEDRFLAKFPVRVIIGKGGMGEKTLAALKKVGAVYTHYTGGAGALAARAISTVTDVHWLNELGMPEAVWVLSVVEFGPLTVAMDAHGKSLYSTLGETVDKNMQAIHDQIERSK